MPYTIQKAHGKRQARYMTMAPAELTKLVKRTITTAQKWAREAVALAEAGNVAAADAVLRDADDCLVTLRLIEAAVRWRKIEARREAERKAAAQRAEAETLRRVALGGRVLASARATRARSLRPVTLATAAEMQTARERFDAAQGLKGAAAAAQAWRAPVSPRQLVREAKERREAIANATAPHRYDVLPETRSWLVMGRVGGANGETRAIVVHGTNLTDARDVIATARQVFGADAVNVETRALYGRTDRALVAAAATAPRFAAVVTSR